MGKMTERGRRYLEIVDRQGHLQERFATEFSELAKYWYASQFMIWVSRNNDNLQKALEVHAIPMNRDIQNFISLRREEIEFHFYNYLASIAGCMSFLFNWAESSGIESIDEVTLECKRNPTVRILNQMRNSILHGARAFSNWGVSMRNKLHPGPGGPGVNCTFDLSETLMEKLTELPIECQEKVSEIQSLQENKLDWLGPLTNDGASLLKTAWNEARKVFEDENKTALETREAIIEELKELEEEYQKIGPLPASELGFSMKPSSGNKKR